MAISKEDIKRSDLIYSMLRRVIIRADFTTMLDLEKIISKLGVQEWFVGKFNNYSKLQLGNPAIIVPGPPKTDSPKRFVRRFDDCNISPERKVSLDITDDSLCMDIQCDSNYTTINEYLALFVETLSFIINNDAFVKISRLAIRKVDGENFKEGTSAEKVFEYFDQGITVMGQDPFWQRTYTDNFFYGKRNIKVNYTRNVKATDNPEARLVFILDIDTYIDAEMIEHTRPSREEIHGIFFERLNESCFDLYKRGVTLEFLISKMRS